MIKLKYSVFQSAQIIIKIGHYKLKLYKNKNKKLKYNLLGEVNLSKWFHCKMFIFCFFFFNSGLRQLVGRKKMTKPETYFYLIVYWIF